jgi:anti-sigma B factor antagonist
MARAVPTTACIYLEEVRGRDKSGAGSPSRAPARDGGPVPRAGVEVVVVSQETVEVRNVAAFRDRLGEAAGPCVVLDLHRVRFMDSSGLGVLLSALRRFQTADGDLKLCALTPPVRRLMEVCRLHKVIEILDTREQALRAFVF